MIEARLSSGLEPVPVEREVRVIRVADRIPAREIDQHDMALVQQVCARVYVLDFGCLIFEGSSREMLASQSVRAAYLGVTTTEPAG